MHGKSGASVTAGEVQASFRKCGQTYALVRSVLPFAVGGLVLLSLAGCGWIERAERPAWRAQAENLCLSRGLVKPSAYIEPEPEISGPGICGMTHPFKVSALADGALSVEKPVTIDCSMIPALEAWLADVVQPIAQARFGSSVTGIDAFGGYSCRSVDNISGARLSEHAFGNAIDIAGFRLVDGREVSIVRDWKRTDTQESTFLHEIHAGACQHFTTVLGPGADVFHYNHFHLDLAMHGSTDAGPRRYCRPFPAPDLIPPMGKPDGPPPSTNIEDPLDTALTPALPRFVEESIALHGPSGALPPPAPPVEDRLVEPETAIDSASTSTIRRRETE
jgi:Extensin-like protein C-terminus